VPSVILHPKAVATLPLVDGRTTEYRDAVVPGLVLRVTPSGHRSFCSRYRRGGRSAPYRRITFGPLGKISLVKARKLAREVFVQLAAGKDPAAEHRRELARSTLPRTVEDLVTRCLGRLELRASTRREWERIAATEIGPALGRRPVDELGRAEVREWREAIAERSTHTANAAFKVLRRAYSWALKQDLVAVSPCAGLGMPAPEVRNDRWLRPHELRALWVALGDVAQESPYPDVVRLLLLTALRRGEVLGARREEFHELEEVEGAEPRWIVPAERTKGALEHVVPLSRQAAELVRRRLESVKGTCLFPALGEDRPAAWMSGFVELLRERVLELVREELEDPEAEVSRWTIHGIRHTVATHLQDSLKVADDVVALILGHRPPGLTDADRIYLRGRKLDERRRALERWADWLERTAAAEPERKVVPGRFRGGRGR
jgi:integrase